MRMGTTPPCEVWSDRVAAAWVRQQPVVDACLRPLGSLALDAAQLMPGERVLDVGCGCGDTLLEVAERVGRGGEVLGIDVSAAMLERAQQRIAALRNVAVLQADAATFVPEERRFDVLVSRFGVMFFADPENAFRQLAAALRPGGRLAFVCWRGLEENAWATTLLHAIKDIIELPPRPAPGEPGPFAFAAGERLRTLLGSAGFVNVAVQGRDQAITLGPLGSVDAAVDYCLEIGPAARAIAEASDAQVRQARAALRDALQPHWRPTGGVWLDAAVWIVSGRVPAGLGH